MMMMVVVVVVVVVTTVMVMMVMVMMVMVMMVVMMMMMMMMMMKTCRARICPCCNSTLIALGYSCGSEVWFSLEYICPWLVVFMSRYKGGTFWGARFRGMFCIFFGT